MSKKLIILFFLSLFVIQFVGCSSYVFHSPKTLSTKSFPTNTVTKIKKVSTKQTFVWFLLLPFSSPMDPRNVWDNLLKEAKKVGGNAVVDVQVRADQSFILAFPPIYVINVETTGMAVKMN